MALDRVHTSTKAQHSPFIQLSLIYYQENTYSTPLEPHFYFDQHHIEATHENQPHKYIFLAQKQLNIMYKMY